jgi:hypothetical protein
MEATYVALAMQMKRPDTSWLTTSQYLDIILSLFIYVFIYYFKGEWDVWDM